MSTSQRAVTSCSWGVKADLVRMWVACKTVLSRSYTIAMSDRYRDGHSKALYKFTLFTLLYIRHSCTRVLVNATVDVVNS